MKKKINRKPTYQQLLRSNRLHKLAIKEMSLELEKANNLKKIITDLIKNINLSLNPNAVAMNLRKDIMSVIGEIVDPLPSLKNNVKEFLGACQKHVLSFRFDEYDDRYVEIKDILERMENIVAGFNKLAQDISRPDGIHPTRVQFSETIMPVTGEPMEGLGVVINPDPVPIVQHYEGEIVSSHRSWFFGIAMVVVKVGDRLHEVEMEKCRIVPADVCLFDTGLW